jgi:hypothetical protein
VAPLREVVEGLLWAKLYAAEVGIQLCFQPVAEAAEAVDSEGR